jgi:hypothetical protein
MMAMEAVEVVRQKTVMVGGEEGKICFLMKVAVVLVGHSEVVMEEHWIVLEVVEEAAELHLELRHAHLRVALVVEAEGLKKRCLDSAEGAAQGLDSAQAVELACVLL